MAAVDSAGPAAEPGGDEVPPCPATAPPAQSPEAKITLLEPGKEPRVALRYRPQVGLGRVITYSLSSKLTSQQSGKTTQQQGMGFSLTVDAKIASADDKQARFDFKVTKLEVPDVAGMPPEFMEGVRKELAVWKDVSGSMTVDNGGITQKLDVSGGGAAAVGPMHDIRVALEQTANPLPEEPVGVGAKWEVATVVDTGLVLRGKTVFELVSLKGKRGAVRFNIEQHSDPKPGPAVCPRPNVVVQPLSWVASGSGERSFNLGELISGGYDTKLQVRNESRTYVTSQGQTQKMAMKVDVELVTKMATGK